MPKPIKQGNLDTKIGQCIKVFNHILTFTMTLECFSAEDKLIYLLTVKHVLETFCYSGVISFSTVEKQQKTRSYISIFNASVIRNLRCTEEMTAYSNINFFSFSLCFGKVGHRRNQT